METTETKTKRPVGKPRQFAESVQIAVPIDATDKEALRELASGQGQRLGTWARGVLLGELAQQGGDNRV